MKSSHVLSFTLYLWLAVLLCHMYDVLAQTRPSRVYYSQRHYNADAINCQNIPEILFLSFFPCLRNDSSFEASENITECDLLAEAGAQLAVERVNEDPDILPNMTVKLYPVYVPNGKGSFTLHDQYAVLLQIFSLLYKPEYSNRIWGVIGPDDNPGVANFVATISARSGVLTVSYGARTANSRTENTQTFYRTLPSNDASNIGRLVLLVNHNWYRIAILTSTGEEDYTEESSHFISIFNQYINNDQIKLDRTETFNRSPDTALENIRARDINIIVGFFGPENARLVLCRAKYKGLISPEHAWVLPSYYDPKWWRSPNSTDCSDEEMKDILESVIFVDNVKLPPVDVSLDQFHGMLIEKAFDLFPSLTGEDLKPYLLRSRATDAYDAVILLARSVGMAFDQGGDRCTDTSLVHAAFKNIFLQCEFCRLYTATSDCFNIKDVQFTATFKHCNKCSNSSSYNVAIDPSEFRDSELYPDPLQNSSRLWHLKNLYGQIIYSQFLNGEECPIVLWWPVSSETDFNLSYLLIDEFDDVTSSTSCAAKHLNLSQRNFVNSDTNCSTHFYWRGSFTPPSSHFLHVSFISIGELTVIAVTVLMGMVFTILLLIFDMLWRKNKNIKASSPWMNVILLIGVLLRLPTSIYTALIFSGLEYAGLMHLTSLCYILIWQYYIGEVLFVATLIAKNWRIYKIFFNKDLKERGYQLADFVLIIGMLVIMLPVIIVLIIWSGFGINHIPLPLQNENLQIVLTTVCATKSEPPLVFESLTNAIIFIMFLILFILSLLTASVPSSTFRREGLATYKAVVLVILPAPLLFLARITLIVSDRGIQYRALLWIEFCWISVLPIILLIILFAPIIYAVVRQHLDDIRTNAEELENEKLSGQYDNLKHRADTLKSQLEQTYKTIRRIKTDLVLGASAGNSLARSSAKSSSWHGTTEMQREVISGSDSTNKVRQSIRETGSRSCTSQERGCRIAIEKVLTIKETTVLSAKTSRYLGLEAVDRGALTTYKLTHVDERL